MLRKTNYMLNGGFSDNASLVLKNAQGENYTTVLDYTDDYTLLDIITLPEWTNMDQPSCSIGYVNMGKLSRDNVDAMMADFSNKDAIIFDVRNYPQGTIYQLLDYLFSKPQNFANFSLPVTESPGDWSYFIQTLANGTATPYSGRLMILMNERTQSHAEYTVMALEQHPNAVKIGSQTAAADGNVQRVYLPGEIVAKYTGLGTYYPDNTPTQRVGLVPDLFIKPSIAGTRLGKDEVLEAALNCDNIADLNWPQAPKLKSALFWDPKHSGTGIDIAEVGDRYTVIPYNFREDGTPVWYLGLATAEVGIVNTIENSIKEYQYNSDSGVTAIDLNTNIRFDFKRGPQEIQCASTSQELKRFPAQMIWDFNDATKTRCEQEFIFANSQATTDFTGLWWGGSTESGWGISLNTQGDKIVAIVYFYDDTGKALWLLGSGNFSSQQPTTLTLKKFTHCASCSENQYPSEDVAELTLSLTQVTNEFTADNWLSLNFGNSIWNRNKMPIKILSTY